MAKDMCKLSGVDEEKDLQPVGVPSQDVVWICGRVCNEASEGRINKASVLLEGSRRDSGGRRYIASRNSYLRDRFDEPLLL
jgi:hypothetical protein